MEHASSLRFDGHTHVLPALPEPLTAVSLDLPRIRLDDGGERDEFGVVWRDGAPAFHPLTDPTSWSAFFAPSPQTDFLAERMETLRDALGLRVCRIGWPLWSRAEALAGRESLLAATEDAPQAAHALLRSVCEGTLAVLEAAMQYDFDLLVLHESWDLTEPLWTAFVRPYLARLYAMGKAYGHPAAQEGCGKAYLPALEALGLDVLIPGYYEEVIPCPN